MSDINLIPGYRRAQQQFRHKMRWWLRVGGGYGVTLMVVLGSAYAVWAGDGDVLAKKLTDTEARIERTQDSIFKLRKQLALCHTQLQTNEILRNQPDWSRLLLVIGEAVGEEVALNTCMLSTLDDKQGQIMEATGVKAGDVSNEVILQERQYKLKISGYSRTQTAVSLFVLRLERLELFSSVRLEKSRRQEFLGEPAVAFAIECDM